MIYTITKDCNSKTPYPYRVTGPGAVDISYSHSIMQMKVYIVDCVINTQVDFNLNKYKGPIKSILIKNEIFNKPVIFDAQDLLKISKGLSGPIRLGLCLKCGRLAIYKRGQARHRTDFEKVRCLIES